MPAISNQPPVNPQFSGVKNFVKNVWRPWDAPKGHRAGPTVGFVALSVLTFGIFAIPGIVSLAKRISMIGKSSPQVRDTANTTTGVFDSNTRISILQTTLRSIEDELRKSTNMEPERLKNLLDSQQKLEKKLASLGFQTKSMSPHESDLLEKVYKDGKINPDFIEKAKSIKLDAYDNPTKTEEPSEFEAALIAIMQDAKYREEINTKLGQFNPFKDGKIKPEFKDAFERFKKAAENDPKDPFSKLNPYKDGKLKPEVSKAFERFKNAPVTEPKDSFSSINPFKGGKLKPEFEEAFRRFRGVSETDTSTASSEVEEEIDVDELRARLAKLREPEKVEAGTVKGHSTVGSVSDVVDDLKTEINDLEKKQRFTALNILAQVAEAQNMLHDLQTKYDNGEISEQEWQDLQVCYENFQMRVAVANAENSSDRDFIDAEKERVVRLEGLQEQIATLESVVAEMDSKIARFPENLEDALDRLEVGSSEYEGVMRQIQERAELQQVQMNHANELDQLKKEFKTLADTPSVEKPIDALKQPTRREWISELASAASKSETRAIYEDLVDLDTKIRRLEAAWSPEKKKELESQLRDAIAVREGMMEENVYLKGHIRPQEGKPPTTFDPQYWTNVIERVRGELSHIGEIQRVFLDQSAEFDAKRKELQRIMTE